MTKMVNVKVNGRWDILLPEHRAARPEWTSEGGWEKARLDHMHKTVKKDDVVYYVGAEEGDMCALLQMWGAKVVMFEPNPAVWANIKGIWEANKLGRPYGALVGFAGKMQRVIPPNDPHPNELPVWSNRGYRGWPECAFGKMIAEHGFKNLCEDDGTLPQYTIDAVVALGNLGVPDMISIDVEGAEWEVLRGAEKTLREYHPRIYLSLHPEFLYEIYKEYANDLRWWLKQMGYKETLLDYQHEVHLVYERIEA